MNNDQLTPLTVEDFATFYDALYGYAPFRWQRQLATQVCHGSWPEYIKLPTASGKTAAVDIAVFALAYQAAASNRVDGKRTAPRRVFFVVDRRIIVNEAYRRAERAAQFLRKSVDASTELKVDDAARFESLNTTQHELLTRVAGWLQHLSADDSAPPLDCFELRGGIYRNDAWVRSPLQPTVLTSTVDQVGSRLLFRGYGVSDRNLSIHAALTANDSLIILDEAHCSKPFSQTMKSIERYRGDQWAEQVVESPFQFVQMTATPPGGLDRASVFELSDEDYEVDEKLALRHQCSKRVRLESPVSGAKTGPGNSKIAKKLATEAQSLANDFGLKKIAIVANRVDIARQAFAELHKKNEGCVQLMIGRMRPIDRDDLTTQLQDRFRSGAKTNPDDASESNPQFVVATQCLEVGADLDFDGMVTQCASLDALRQRFGRLNRLGESPLARGTIVTGEGDVPSLDKLDPSKPLDPVYGNALAYTWHWLNKVSTSTATEGSDDSHYEVDFGISQLDQVCQQSDREINDLLAPSPNAPVLMPAHVDMLCQTSPRPTPEPNVADYLHGPNRGQREVRVCWRADLDVSGEFGGDKNWVEAIELCPPSSAECLSVPLSLFRKWLRDEAKVSDESSDVLSEADTEADENGKTDRSPNKSPRKVLVWRGKRKTTKDGHIETRSFVADAVNIRNIRPNDTIVVPAEFGGWNLFGHIPNAPPEPSLSEIEEQNKADQKQAESPDASAESELHEDEIVVKELATIDVAEPAFLQCRARTLWRIHPKLNAEPEAKSLWDALLAESKKVDNMDLAMSRWRNEAVALAKMTSADSQTPARGEIPPLLIRLTKWGGKGGSGKIVSYPGGVVWITDRHEHLTTSILPLPSFGDDDDTLSLQGQLALKQHLADVYEEASRLVRSLELPKVLTNTILESARFHDLGKADPRFQAMLLGKPLSVAFMQRKLWAKSESYSRFANSELPTHFRHEMLSLWLLECFTIGSDEVDEDLLKHETASHHGFARPFAPVCDDPSPLGVNLASLNGPVISSHEREQWKAAHCLDSGVPERFWSMTRTYGWWGLAFLESVLRLADWFASANPRRGVESSLCLSPRTDRPPQTAAHDKPLVLTGLDGSNPLAFLAALGLFRVISLVSPSDCFRLSWSKSQGAWRPVVSSPRSSGLTAELLLDLLCQNLCNDPESHPALRLASRLDNGNEMRDVFDTVAALASTDDRTEADWLSCNGSDIAGSENISQLQTTRRDYHAINMRGLIAETKLDHLRRSLFEPWDYGDPIAGVSLHLEPREDRRHAYQWHMPSGDPTRKICGGMIGANRLALESWPLFQSLPFNEKLITVGFRGTKANNTRFSWPIWSTPLLLAVLPSVLSLGEVQRNDVSGQHLDRMGIKAIFRCSRILVGKTPNLTSPVAAKT